MATHSSARGSSSQKVRNHLFSNLSWFNRAYLVDWGVLVILFLCAKAIKDGPIYERDFAPDDPIISHPQQVDQISGSMNWFMSVVTPMAIGVTLGFLRLSSHEAHHAALSCFAGWTISSLITTTLKVRIGRLRPDFLDRCAWDTFNSVCTGSPKIIREGRKSFPSGHSTTAFSGLGFLFLFLAGKTGAFCLTTVIGRKAHHSRLLMLILTAWPLALAGWVAVSRVEDYRHHKEDVIVGSLIGFSCACAAYFIYWPNPFSARLMASGLASQARFVYGEDGDTDVDPRAEHFELAPMHDDEENRVLYDEETQAQPVQPNSR
ncbi:hypothetical protein FRB93_000053 [Tulasnella sp. JGI-2019a]|nr:hypothetical protein FRB93_000053 [Tulasnella sp. JGI-2019a]